MTNIIITKEYKYLGEYPLFKENGLQVGYMCSLCITYKE